MGSRDIVLLFL